VALTQSCVVYGDHYLTVCCFLSTWSCQVLCVQTGLCCGLLRGGCYAFTLVVVYKL
jgi:hypothetical protein